MDSWSDLPLDLLGLVLARFSTHPVDRARIAAVCRSWRSAVRHHERRRLPWIMLWEDQFCIPFDFGGRPLSLQYFPDGGGDVAGSTDSWLAVAVRTKYEFKDGAKYIYDRYVLHNPFSNTIVPLAVLSDIIDNVGAGSTGKGAWVADPYKSPYIHIIDVAFMGDTLYAITRAEDLIALDLALDGEGKPVVDIGKRPPGYDDNDAWSTSDDTDSGEEEDQEQEDDDDAEEEEKQEIAYSDDNIEEEVASDGSHSACSPEEYRLDEETYEYVRHHLSTPHCVGWKITHGEATEDNVHVDVLEADTTTRTWVPLPTGSGLGGGRALFISMCFSKSVSAPCGEVEEDVIYDMNTGEVFDMKSRTSRQGRFCKPWQGITWLFPPELVL
ncbi:unnamed protein product [Alopecurus aequalis]